MNGRFNVVEGVTDSESFGFVADRVAGVPGCAGRVDIEENRFFGIVKLQVKQLSDN
jgi:hypothetical protein